MPSPRLSFQTLKILSLLLTSPGVSGSFISEFTGIQSGTVYPTLARLRRAGWILSTWEDADPRVIGRPRRRWHRLTRRGERKATDALAALQEKLDIG